MIKLTEQQKRNQQKRSWMIAGLLVAFILLVFGMSIIQIGRFWDAG